MLDVPTVLVARTDANSAQLLTSDVDQRDRRFITGERTPEGFFRIAGGLDIAIDRGLSYAPYADLLWCETSTPDLAEARRFAEAIHAEFPGKLLAYNCSPSFNWKKKLDDATIARFQRELGAMGYKFQFITLAGFHALNLSMFELARGYRDSGMTAYAGVAGARVRPRGRQRLSGRPSTSGSSARAISTKWPRRSPAAALRPPRCADRPKRRSSRPNRRRKRKQQLRIGTRGWRQVACAGTHDGQGDKRMNLSAQRSVSRS